MSQVMCPEQKVQTSAHTVQERDHNKRSLLPRDFLLF